MISAVESLKQTNADVDGVKADVSLKAELKAAAETAVGRYGKVHILVNNAGVGGGRPYGAWTDAGWEWTLGVNLMAVVWGIEIFGPLIEQHGEGGHIVSTASIAGLISSGGGIQYTYPNMASSLYREGFAANSLLVGSACRCCVRDSSVPRSWTSWRNLPERFGQISADRLAAIRASGSIQDDAAARLERG